MSNRLDPDQARHFVGPDLGPNCLQKLSEDDTSRQRVNIFMCVSDPGIGEYHTMPMNHLNICKPKDQNSDLYILTQRFISKCLFQKHVDDVLSFGEFMSRNNK